MKKNQIITTAYHAVRIIAAVLLLSTLRHKFGGTELSRELFTTLGSETWSRVLSFGGEPYGRYISGALELCMGILLLVPRTALYGALMATGAMLVAIVLHIGILGIDATFYLAVVILVCCEFVIFYNKDKLIEFISKLKK